MTPFRSASLLPLGLLTLSLTLGTPFTAQVRAQEATPVTATSPPVVNTPAAPAVPTEITFADQKLRLNDGGRAAVQKLVDALYRHPAYLDQKVERANTYFPIIDRILKEEGVPAEFRYLAMQESGLVSDAVSTSNAVGFWQFKKEAASDFEVKVNDQVDERRHIVESTRAAARYFKRSNAQLKNWTNSLMSYYTGLGGAKKLVKPEDTDAKEMQITEATHTYVITFLAHKVAFESRVGADPAITLQEVKAKPGQTLTELATSLSANPEEVAKYNKWLLADAVPADKEYTVLVPVPTPTAPVLATAVETPVAQAAFPTPQLPAPEVTQINGLRAVVARKGDSPQILALVAGMDVKRFRALNDLGENEGVVDGRAYYLQKKRNKAVTEYHVVQHGESLQQVAQQYGVKVKAILKKNRLKAGDAVEPGRLLWLQHTRPSAVPVEYVSIKLPDAAPATASTAAVPTPAVVPADVAQDTADTDGKLDSLNAAAGAPTATATTSPATTPAPVTPAPAPATAAPASATPAAPASVPTTAPATATTPKATTAPTATTASATPTAPTTTPAPAASPAATPKATPAATPAAPAPTAPPKAQPAQTAPPQTHTVAKGETLSTIGRRYSVSLKDLMAWNGLENANLKPGQVLKVSAPADATAVAPLPPAKPDLDSAGATYHTVRAGESLYRISKQYNTTVQTLMEWNGLSDFNVKLGQKLVVKK